MRDRAYLQEAVEWSQPLAWEQSRSWIKVVPSQRPSAPVREEREEDVIELTEESTQLVERLVTRPGERIPRLAAALARTK